MSFRVHLGSWGNQIPGLCWTSCREPSLSTSVVWENAAAVEFAEVDRSRIPVPAERVGLVAAFGVYWRWRPACWASVAGKMSPLEWSPTCCGLNSTCAGWSFSAGTTEKNREMYCPLACFSDFTTFIEVHREDCKPRDVETNTFNTCLGFPKWIILGVLLISHLSYWCTVVTLKTLQFNYRVNESKKPPCG